jgi:hypothetical protein
MDDIFELETKTQIDRNNSYILSYPHIANYFATIEEFQARDVVVCSHVVYGWMPTALDLYVNKQNITLNEAANIANKAKRSELLTETELKNLSKLINNSLVGTSKLLHFTNPDKYPIWDSKIYRYVYSETPHNYRVNMPEKYIKYVQSAEEMTKDSRFPAFIASVIEKVGYKVSGLRAIELVMFLNSNKNSG